MKVKAISAIVFIQIVFIQIALVSTSAWADSDSGSNRPRISDVGGEDHSPGVTAVIFLTLLIVGFGIGFIVGRHTKSAKK